MPVNLPKTVDAYPRTSDKLAKSKLKNFHASIFYAPLASWLGNSYEDINSECESMKKPKLSIQSYHCFEKINEVQTFKQSNTLLHSRMSSELLVHVFLQKDKKSKKTIEGQEQRLSLISSMTEQIITIENITEHLQFLKKHHSNAKIVLDDCIDSLFLSAVSYVLGLESHPLHYDKLLVNELRNAFNLFK